MPVNNPDPEEWNPLLQRAQREKYVKAVKEVAKPKKPGCPLAGAMLILLILAVVLGGGWLIGQTIVAFSNLVMFML